MTAPPPTPCRCRCCHKQPASPNRTLCESCSWKKAESQLKTRDRAKVARETSVALVHSFGIPKPSPAQARRRAAAISRRRIQAKLSHEARMKRRPQ